VRGKFFKTKAIKVTLDKKRLQKNIFNDGQRIIKSMIYPIVEAKINAAQKEMIEEFQNHPVTKEISAGENASNSSGLLGGYGNLFSFIGFDQGSDPIGSLDSIFKRKIDFVLKSTNDRGGFSIIINYPSQQSLEASAQVKWMGGRSWIDGIEKGISGLDSFLYMDAGIKNSRSGSGIQSKNKIRGVTQNKTPYVSEILDKFKNRLTQLF